MRSDPTRALSSLRLGGLATAVAAPAASHFTALGLRDYRWEFLPVAIGASLLVRAWLDARARA